MKQNLLFITILLLLSRISIAQKTKTLENYKGTIVFKETNFLFYIDRDLTDINVSYSDMDVDSVAKITEFAFLRNKDISFSYLPFRFIKRSDSLFIRYVNPTGNRMVMNYFLPLNKRDTLDYEGYTLFVDSNIIRNESGALIYKKIIGSNNDDFEFKTVYKKDTLIKSKEYVLDCYMIEMLPEKHRHFQVKRKLLIDKKSLLPVHEEEYRYFKYEVYPNLKNKWLLARSKKILSID